MSQTPPEHTRTLDITSDFSEARRVQEEIEQKLQEYQYDDKTIFSIKLAVEEAIVNAIKHGNQLETHKKVTISYTITPDRFDIRICDEGAGFNPDDVPDPTDISNLERPCGRGLFIIRKFMTEVQFQGKGNEVIMTKVRPEDQQ